MLACSYNDVVFDASGEKQGCTCGSGKISRTQGSGGIGYLNADGFDLLMDIQLYMNGLHNFIHNQVSSHH